MPELISAQSDRLEKATAVGILAGIGLPVPSFPLIPLPAHGVAESVAI